MQIEIRKAQESDRLGITKTLVMAFYEQFKAITKSYDILNEIISDAIEPKRFIVAKDTITSEIIGSLSLSDRSGYAASVNEELLIQHFGWLKGKIVSGILKDEFIRPKSFAGNEAYIANVSVHESYRGNGIANSMLLYAIENEDYKCFQLDVIEGNEKALPLYQRVGFVETRREKEKGGWIKGFKFRYILTYCS